MSWGSSASSSSSQAASSPLSDRSGRSSSSATAPRPPTQANDQIRSARQGEPSARGGWGEGFTTGERCPRPAPRRPLQHLPHPPCKALPPGLRVPERARGGRGLSPAPRRRGLGAGRAGGRGYPPIAPDANEHMAAVPREPGVQGAGTRLRNARECHGTLVTGTRERAGARSQAGAGGTSRALETRERARWRASASGPQTPCWSSDWVGGALSQTLRPPLAAGLKQCEATMQ